MPKIENLMPQPLKRNISFKFADDQIARINKFFSGRKYQTSAEFRKLLVGVILAFGILIFFLNTVDFNKVRLQGSVFPENPPPPPELVVPPPPPPEILVGGDVQGEQANARSSPCYFGDRGYGDVNGDGVVSPEDASMSVRSTNLDSTQKKAADVDGNGIVDFVGDGMNIAKYAAGVISTFPVCATNSLTPTPSPTTQSTLPPGTGTIRLEGYSDCQGTDVIVHLSWSGGSPPYTVHRINPYYPNYATVSGTSWDSDPQPQNQAQNWGITVQDANGDLVASSNALHVNARTCDGSVTPTPTPTPRSPSPRPPTPSPLPPTANCAPLRIVSLNSPVQAGADVNVQVQVGNTSCNNLPVWFFLGSIGSNWQKAQCIISGTGCSVKLKAPQAPGIYYLVAVADLNRNGRWYEPGEYNVRVISVTGSSTNWPFPIPK